MHRVATVFVLALAAAAAVVVPDGSNESVSVTLRDTTTLRISNALETVTLNLSDAPLTHGACTGLRASHVVLAAFRITAATDVSDAFSACATMWRANETHTRAASRAIVVCGASEWENATDECARRTTVAARVCAAGDDDPAGTTYAVACNVAAGAVYALIEDEFELAECEADWYGCNCAERDAMNTDNAYRAFFWMGVILFAGGWAVYEFILFIDTGKKHLAYEPVDGKDRNSLGERARRCWLFTANTAPFWLTIGFAPLVIAQIHFQRGGRLLALDNPGDDLASEATKQDEAIGLAWLALVVIAAIDMILFATRCKGCCDCCVLEPGGEVRRARQIFFCLLHVLTLGFIATITKTHSPWTYAMVALPLVAFSCALELWRLLAVTCECKRMCCCCKKLNYTAANLFVWVINILLHIGVLVPLMYVRCEPQRK